MRAPLARTSAALAASAVLAGAVPAVAAPLRPLEGAVHEHTAYSDGAPGSRPADAFAAVAARGWAFMASTEHSDTLDLPTGSTNGSCRSERLPECLAADDEQPANAARKWAAIGEQADAATAPGRFAAIRGFEWTNDRHGHINVLFSRHYTSAKRDGGYVDMRAFWDWFNRSPALGGGSDGLGIFNHPGRRELGRMVPGGFIAPYTPDTPAPGADWDDFAHVPAADARMVGIELFNGRSDFGAPTAYHPFGAYGEALDAGWHVGAVGAEDTHGRSWGDPRERKTVVLARRVTRGALEAALLARRFYAIRRAGIRLGFTVDGRGMGARLQLAPGRRLRLAARTSVRRATLEVVTTGGAVVERGGRRLRIRRPASPGERWYVVRARDARGRAVAYSSPVWVTAARR